MIRRLSHNTVYCLDQERAKQFYVDKLGFEVRQDEGVGSFRWLTVAPKGQTDLAIVLMPIATNPMMDADTVATMRALVQKGVFGGGVFTTADCRRTYEELKARGVEFMDEPAERPYGIEALFRDDSGNWFSLCQPR